MSKLTCIDDLQDFPKRLLAKASVLARIECLLEDLNVETIEMHAEFDLGGARRDGIFHASSIGGLSGKSLCGRYPMGCARQLYYSFQGAESEDAWQPRIRRILDTGTAVHSQLQRYLEEVAKRSDGTETFVPEADINPQTNEIADQMDISGHTDGIYTINDGKDELRFGLEIKTINDAGYKKTAGPHPEHIMQGTIYQKCLDLPLMVFVYYNKNDSSIAEFTQVFDPERWDAIVSKLNYVRDCAMGDELPTQEVGWQCTSCKYKGSCKPPKKSRGRNDKAASAFRKGR